jgi:hypothetical protein
MATGAGAYSGRYAGLRRLPKSLTAPENAAIPATAATTKMGILNLWKKLFLLDPELDPDPDPELELELCCCEPVVSSPLRRAVTKSAWAAAGFVVERI